MQTYSEFILEMQISDEVEELIEAFNLTKAVKNRINDTINKKIFKAAIVNFKKGVMAGTDPRTMLRQASKDYNISARHLERHLINLKMLPKNKKIDVERISDPRHRGMARG